jgi:hypothetical protein
MRRVGRIPAGGVAHAAHVDHAHIAPPTVQRPGGVSDTDLVRSAPRHQAREVVSPVYGESLAIIEGLWRGEPFSYRGKH